MIKVKGKRLKAKGEKMGVEKIGRWEAEK